MEQKMAPQVRRLIRDLPQKPQRSTNYKNIGNEIQLVSNHYKINFEKVFKEVHIFDVKIFDAQNDEVPQDARRLRQTIYRSIEKKVKDNIGRHYVSGMNIWAFRRGDITPLETNLGNKTYVVKITWRSQENPQDLLNKQDLGLQLRQILNVMVKSYLKELGYIDIGQNEKYYNKDNRNDNIVHSQNSALKVWYGYKTSFDIIQKNPLLLIDFSSRVLRDETALARILSLSKQGYSKGDILEHFKEHSVMASYGNFKIYRIHDIQWERRISDSFQGKNEVSTTFVDYYKTRYNIQLRDRNQPLLVHKDKKTGLDIVLIPEICNMTGIEDEERANRNLMTDLAKFTKHEPRSRLKLIQTLNDQLKKKFQADNFDLVRLENMKGLLLNPPALIVGKNKEVRTNDGNFMLRDPVYSPFNLKDWLFVYCSARKGDDDDVDDFMDMLKKAGNTFGIKFAAPYFIVTNNFQYRDWEKEILNEVKKGKSLPEMIVTWIPEKQKGLYKDFKKLFYSNIGIPHQNLLSNKYLNSKNKMSHCSKIILQMNVKLGYPLWVVNPIPQLSKKAMIVGVDVYHKTINKSNSCAGFVASLDDKFSKFYSSSMIQGVGQELMTSITTHLEEALKMYFQENNRILPEIIILYRDGVGESQINDVLNVEIEQIKQMFKLVGEKAKQKNTYQPQFLEILVTKRINHRFFSQNRDDYFNPPSGTLVNDHVVHDYHEFFLIPQKVTQGTATPSQYKVLANNSTLTSDQIEQFTFHQCFNYANWTGAVRVPGPVQYAHKLAFLVGDHMKTAIKPSLSKSLCYL